MKFVHAADLHVDSPMRGLDRYEGAPVAKLRGATRRALENLVSLCLDERVAFLLLAGDVFDGSWKDYSTGLFFVAQMARLREAKIPVVLVRGNHDAASAITKALRLPDNVRELSSKKPETVTLEAHDTCIHGQSFAQRATTEDLAARYPAPVGSALNIGLLHTCLDGREGHEPYAPTTLEALRSKGYDYWALGHVHAREVLDRHPWIVFPGNLQGRHARETGSKGASLVTVSGGVIEAVEHRELDVVRWEQVRVDVSAASDPADAIDLVRAAIVTQASAVGDRTLAARVVVTGATKANGAIRRDPDRFVSELRAASIDGLGEAAWVEKVVLQTLSTFDMDKIRKEATAVGHLARRLAEIKATPEELASLGASLADLDKRLPAELREGDAPFSLTDPTMLRAFLDDVEQTLIPRLLEGTEE